MDRRKTFCFFGVRDELISLFNAMRTKAKASPLYQETQIVLRVAPFWIGGRRGSIHLWLFIHCAFRNVLCKDPLKTNENWHKRVWLIPESAGPYPRTHAMVVIESWFTKNIGFCRCVGLTAAASLSLASTAQTLGLGWALKPKICSLREHPPCLHSLRFEIWVWGTSTSHCPLFLSAHSAPTCPTASWWRLPQQLHLAGMLHSAVTELLADASHLRINYTPCLVSLHC